MRAARAERKASRSIRKTFYKRRAPYLRLFIASAYDFAKKRLAATFFAFALYERLPRHYDRRVEPFFETPLLLSSPRSVRFGRSAKRAGRRESTFSSFPRNARFGRSARRAGECVGKREPIKTIVKKMNIRLPPRLRAEPPYRSARVWRERAG